MVRRERRGEQEEAGRLASKKTEEGKGQPRENKNTSGGESRE